MTFSRKIVIVGNSTVGKTAILKRILKSSFTHEYSPTIFDQYKKELNTNCGVVNVEIWDTAGQEKYDKLRPLSFDKANLIILAFNIADKFSFASIHRRWYPEAKHNCPYVKFMLLGLKSDLRNELPNILVPEEEVVSLARRYGWNYLECSALTGENSDKVILVALKSIEDENWDDEYKDRKCVLQ